MNSLFVLPNIYYALKLNGGIFRLIILCQNEKETIIECIDASVQQHILSAPVCQCEGAKETKTTVQGLNLAYTASP